jgi:hypothetical protein
MTMVDFLRAAERKGWRFQDAHSNFSTHLGRYRSRDLPG